MPHIRVSDVLLHYEETGQGPPVVLIMGLAGSLEWWGPEIQEALSRRFRVVVFDNRGAGRSDRPKDPYTIAQMAEDTRGLMDALGIDRAHVLGYSMGGMIAQELALRHPERLRRLILAATSPGGVLSALPRPRAFGLLLAERDPERAARATLELLFPPDYVASHAERMIRLSNMLARHATDAASAKRQFAAILRWSAWSRLPRLSVPTLVVHGTADILLPVRNARILHRRIPRSEIRLFPGAGHGFGLQFAEETAETVLGFLEGS